MTLNRLIVMTMTRLSGQDTVRECISMSGGFVTLVDTRFPPPHSLPRQTVPNGEFF